MVVFCVETKPNPKVLAFVNNFDKTISQINVKTFFFKRTSFIYLVQERRRYVIIVNLQAVLIPLPRFFLFWVMKKGLKKFGYTDKPKLVNTGEVFGLVIKRFKQWRKKK